MIALEGSEVDLAVAPSLFEVVTRRMTIETVGNVPLLHVDQVRLRRGKAALKRTLDLVAASGLGIVSVPLVARGRGGGPDVVAGSGAVPSAPGRA
jgi:hypothetical protein